MSKKYEILLYTSDNCTFCNSAKELLKNKKLNFKEINISKNNLLKKKMVEKTNGLMTVPQIFINSNHKPFKKNYKVNKFKRNFL